MTHCSVNLAGFRAYSLLPGAGITSIVEGLGSLQCLLAPPPGGRAEQPQEQGDRTEPIEQERKHAAEYGVIGDGSEQGDVEPGNRDKVHVGSTDVAEGDCSWGNTIPVGAAVTVPTKP